MNKLHTFFFFLFLSGFALAQVDDSSMQPADGKLMNGRQLKDTIGSKFNTEKEFDVAKTHYTDYKIISYLNDSTIIDTTLSYRKDQISNHLRKSNFELLPLHNLGQTYTKLGYDFSSIQLLPKTGMREKHYDFIEAEDVNYYRVPTPTSILHYRSGIQQGQVLNSMLTANLTPELNVSLAYKGLRSLGNYRQALASRQNFRITSSYQSKNKAYRARVHFVSHNLMNEENGGLTTSAVEYFITNSSDYTDRGRLETNYTNAESTLKDKRYYIENSYNLWQQQDSAGNSFLQLGHELVYSHKYYQFLQDKSSSFIGETYQDKITDSTYHKTLNNSIYAKLKSPYILGTLGVKAVYSNYDYGYNSVLFLTDQTIPQKLKGNTLSVAANWNTDIKYVNLQTNAGAILQGKLKGNYLKGIARFTKDSLFTAKATLLLQSQSPNFNFLLYQSNYIDYNWHPNLENENTRYLSISLASKKWADAEVSMTQKDFYTYFDENSKPQQYAEILNYMKIKAHKAISYKKFTLDNTLLFQRVMTGKEVFRVPELLTENSLYYTDYLFKGKPLFLQAGFTFKYFTKYQANAFNPLLNEFVLQNTREIGNYPMLDVFVNGQIRRTRLFFKAENIPSLWGQNVLATPTHAYRDFTLRFGVVWNFFI